MNNLYVKNEEKQIVGCDPVGIDRDYGTEL